MDVVSEIKIWDRSLRSGNEPNRLSVTSSSWKIVGLSCMWNIFKGGSLTVILLVILFSLTLLYYYTVHIQLSTGLLIEFLIYEAETNPTGFLLTPSWKIASYMWATFNGSSFTNHNLYPAIIFDTSVLLYGTITNFNWAVNWPLIEFEMND